ncbi:MAG: RNA pseudouridine synthase [Planctomycetales bacterium]|nr:RNA pseudouridine synthase [Planctomycetales bacterium]
MPSEMPCPSAAAASPPLEILCEDGPVIVINKPAGLLTQGVPHGIPTLEAQVKAYLKEKHSKSGNVYLGIPHRLDRPVSGVVLFARNSKAAARLAEQFRERQVKKIYWSVLERPPEPANGTLNDFLLKHAEQAHVEVVSPVTAGAKSATLHYRTLQTGDNGTLVEIELETGRMHQIRVQFGSRGWPVLGDTEYGATRLFDSTESPADPRDARIALHARSLTFLHPIRYDSVTVTAPLPAAWRTLPVSVIADPNCVRHDTSV